MPQQKTGEHQFLYNKFRDLDYSKKAKKMSTASIILRALINERLNNMGVTEECSHTRGRCDLQRMRTGRWMPNSCGTDSALLAFPAILATASPNARAGSSRSGACRLHDRFK